ncbi:non-ribosomal peptide synthetase [Mucilaginibacter ginkgonis]|uniref:Amino acid adenylation domain-containing protein n=1 Tax=Mucilaginibacter ginkgonis TaxID=2682091 RepID=A0A6I4I7J5_9SPHI|nr:amino acid adenylation domain-containing protein [Mucilaginibacter ginkgonis]QQL49087.1 amino acid adenylation domain-containing protein [Mucilaginibacter ginkgonis]
MDFKDPALLANGILRLDQLFEQQAAQRPDKTALKYHGETYSYKKLNNNTGQWALYLQEKEIKQGDVVAVALERSPELIFAILAIVKAGATYLPIDTNLPAARINYMLADCGAEHLITSKKSLFNNQEGLISLFVEDIWQDSSKYNSADYVFNAGADDIAYILYTSGSTGTPKGVQVKHSGLTNLLLSIQKSPGCTAKDIVLATTTISFDIAALEIFLPLVSGATLVLADADIIKDGRLLIDTARKEGITIMQGTPIMWVNMLESGWANALKIKVFCGGEAMSRELAGGLLPKCLELWNMYGPTETTIYSIIKRVTAEDKIITIGGPIDNTQIYICDEQQNEVAEGETGEIYIGGTGVGAGYVKKPELTNEKFIDDKFSRHGKLYRTGDLGRYIENGDIQCLGRVDHQIKIRGYRIETEEIEYQLKQLGDIKDALVVLFTDFLGHQHLGAYVVLNDAEGVINAAKQNNWKSGLKKTLPEYMVPDVFKAIPAIPRLVNGKIDRKSLPEFVIGEGVVNKFEEAGSATEKSLSAIALKHIAIQKIGINDNFFDLGMDSLTAVKIMVDIEQQFCKRLPLSMMIRYPTIKELAAFLDRDTPDNSYKSLIPLKPEGSKVPLYIVHGIGLNLLNVRSMVASLDEDQPVFGLQPVGLDGTMTPMDNMEDIAKFYIDEIIAHNPVGPYLIAGYSFGGYIAFEMARQLKLRGKEVAMLGMFDSNILPKDWQLPIFERMKKKLTRQILKVPFRIGTLFTHPVEALKYLSVYSAGKARNILSRFGVKFNPNPDNLPVYMLDIIGKLETAYRNYKLQPLDIELILFKARIRMFYVDEGKYLGWKKYALKGIRVYNVPGDHKDMFNPPNDKQLATVLQKRLDDVQSHSYLDTPHHV